MRNQMMILVLLGLLISTCGPGQFLGPTITPSATSTPSPTQTPIPPTPTRTPIPSKTPTRAPTRTPTPTIPPPEFGHYAGTSYNVPWVSFYYNEDGITGFSLEVETWDVGKKYTCTLTQPGDVVYPVSDSFDQPGAKFFLVGSVESGTTVFVTLSGTTATGSYSILFCGPSDGAIVYWTGDFIVIKK
jgi:hypothetical protein